MSSYPDVDAAVDAVVAAATTPLQTQLSQAQSSLQQQSVTAAEASEAAAATIAGLQAQIAALTPSTVDSVVRYGVTVARPAGPTKRTSEMGLAILGVAAAFRALPEPTNVIIDSVGYFDANGFADANNQTFNFGTNLLSLATADLSHRATGDPTQDFLLRLAPGTMSAASKAKIPAQSTSASGGTNPLSILTLQGPIQLVAGFGVVGTDQGANYHGLSIFNPTGVDGKPVVDGTVMNMYTRGWRGDNSANPGECFGDTLHGCDGWHLFDSEADGRYFGDDAHSWGAVGWTVQNSQGVMVRGMNVHDVTQSYAVGYQVDSLDVDTVILGRPGGDLPAGIPGLSVKHLFNLERTSNTRIANGQFNKADKKSGTHFSHSNPASFKYTFRNGNTVDMSDGKLTVVNPTWQDIWGDGLFYGQRFYDSNTVTAPLVVQSDGSTHIKYQWVDGSGHHWTLS